MFSGTVDYYDSRARVNGFATSLVITTSVQKAHSLILCSDLSHPWSREGKTWCIFEITLSKINLQDLAKQLHRRLINKGPEFHSAPIRTIYCEQLSTYLNNGGRGFLSIRYLPIFPGAHPGFFSRGGPEQTFYYIMAIMVRNFNPI